MQGHGVLGERPVSPAERVGRTVHEVPVAVAARQSRGSRAQGASRVSGRSARRGPSRVRAAVLTARHGVAQAFFRAVRPCGGAVILIASRR